MSAIFEFVSVSITVTVLDFLQQATYKFPSVRHCHVPGCLINRSTRRAVDDLHAARHPSLRGRVWSGTVTPFDRLARMREISCAPTSKTLTVRIAATKGAVGQKADAARRSLTFTDSTTSPLATSTISTLSASLLTYSQRPSAEDRISILHLQSLHDRQRRRA
jgi:hypothetical protein